jgi:hypothetical protein
VALFGRVARVGEQGERRWCGMAGMWPAWPCHACSLSLPRVPMLGFVREGTREPFGASWGRLVRVESLFAIVCK